MLAAPLVAPKSGADICIGECPVLAKVEARGRLGCAFGERLANLINNEFLCYSKKVKLLTFSAT